MRPHAWDHCVRVLLVEDNSADAKLVKTLLKQCRTKFMVDLVTDGEAAIDFLLKRGAYETAESPDLILLDLNLPKKNGKEVLSEVKAHPILKSTPVIVLSTSNSEEDISRSYSLHANSFITKPSELQDFVDAVRSIETFWLHTARLPRRAARDSSAGWDWNL